MLRVAVEVIPVSNPATPIDEGGPVSAALETGAKEAQAAYVEGAVGPVVRATALPDEAGRKLRKAPSGTAVQVRTALLPYTTFPTGPIRVAVPGTRKAMAADDAPPPKGILQGLVGQHATRARVRLGTEVSKAIDRARRTSVLGTTLAARAVPGRGAVVLVHVAPAPVGVASRTRAPKIPEDAGHVTPAIAVRAAVREIRCLAAPALGVGRAARRGAEAASVLRPAPPAVEEALGQETTFHVDAVRALDRPRVTVQATPGGAIAALRAAAVVGRLDLTSEIRAPTASATAVDARAALVDEDTAEVETRSVPVGPRATASPVVRAASFRANSGVESSWEAGPSHEKDKTPRAPPPHSMAAPVRNTAS